MIDHAEDNNVDDQMKRTLSNTEIVAQSILFLLAGYDTTSSALKFIAYNLAHNPKCQQKLCDEIDFVLEKHVSVTNKCKIKPYINNYVYSMRFYYIFKINLLLFLQIFLLQIYFLKYIFSRIKRLFNYHNSIFISTSQ